MPKHVPPSQRLARLAALAVDENVRTAGMGTRIIGVVDDLYDLHETIIAPRGTHVAIDSAIEALVTALAALTEV